MEFKKIANIIADVLGVDPGEITEDTTFLDDLGADSLDVYQMIMELEEEFGIEIDENKIEGMKTVKDALKLIYES